MKTRISPSLATCLFLSGLLVGHAAAAASELSPSKSLLTALKSPILLQGNSKIAYRDPMLMCEGGTFYLFYSYVREEEDRKIYWYTALSTSRDLRNWTEPRPLTAKDQNLNFSSPGNAVRFGGEWILCLQTYPQVDYRRGENVRFGDERSRLFIMRSPDLEHWGQPELIRVKGPDVPEKDMGRMIDPFLLQDKDDPGKWWCFYKQQGAVFYSWSRDLKSWNPIKEPVAAGENPCVIVENNEYVLFYAPRNGVGVKRSTDLKDWRTVGDPITLGQKNWPWAETRLTAGYVADLRKVPGVGKYVMVFHGMGPGKQTSDANVNAHCPIGIAWSGDLKTWIWPGQM